MSISRLLEPESSLSVVLFFVVYDFLVGVEFPNYCMTSSLDNFLVFLLGSWSLVEAHCLLVVLISPHLSFGGILILIRDEFPLLFLSEHKELDLLFLIKGVRSLL